MPPSSPTPGSTVVYIGKPMSRPRTLLVSQSDTRSETSDYCGSPGSMQFNSSPAASPSHPNTGHHPHIITPSSQPLMGGVHPAGGPILPSMSPLLPSMGPGAPRRSSTGKSGAKQLRPVREEARTKKGPQKLEVRACLIFPFYVLT